MSLIDQFYEEYDNLMIKYGGVNKFFNILGDQRVSGYINRSRRDGTMPPPTQLKRFENYMDNQFLLECMQYYGDNYPEKMTIKRIWRWMNFLSSIVQKDEERNVNYPYS